MNQQRSRRFRASKETAEKVFEISKIRSELAAKGAHLPPEKKKEDHFDSNCITPVSLFFSFFFFDLHFFAIFLKRLSSFSHLIPIHVLSITGYSIHGKIVQLSALLHSRQVK